MGPAKCIGEWRHSISGVQFLALFSRKGMAPLCIEASEIDCQPRYKLTPVTSPLQHAPWPLPAMYVSLVFCFSFVLTFVPGPTSLVPRRRRRPRLRPPLLSTLLYSASRSLPSLYFVRTSKPCMSPVLSPQLTSAPLHAVFTLQPLTHSLVHSERVSPFKTGLFTWPVSLFQANYKDVQRVNGPDAYFFVRFLRVMIRVFVPIWIISWIVLLPVSSVNNNIPGNTGLSTFSFGNIEPGHKDRYAAYIILVWLSTCEWSHMFRGRFSPSRNSQFGFSGISGMK